LAVRFVGGRAAFLLAAGVSVRPFQPFLIAFIFLSFFLLSYFKESLLSNCHRFPFGAALAFGLFALFLGVIHVVHDEPL
jgi:hypothetical protein